MAWQLRAGITTIDLAWRDKSPDSNHRIAARRIWLISNDLGNIRVCYALQTSGRSKQTAAAIPGIAS